MTVLDTTFSSGLNKAFHYKGAATRAEGGVATLGPGSFEIRFDGGVRWEVHMPEGSSREDWDREFEKITRGAGPPHRPARDVARDILAKSGWHCVGLDDAFDAIVDIIRADRGEES